MIRITTDQAMDAWLEALLPDDCTRNDRLSCPVCAARRTVRAAAGVVRKNGGVK